MFAAPGAQLAHTLKSCTSLGTCLRIYVKEAARRRRTSVFACVARSVLDCAEHHLWVTVLVRASSCKCRACVGFLAGSRNASFGVAQRGAIGACEMCQEQSKWQSQLYDPLFYLADIGVLIGRSVKCGQNGSRCSASLFHDSRLIARCCVLKATCCIL
eukprot:6921863-Prymnesium_polylepis.1